MPKKRIRIAEIRAAAADLVTDIEAIEMSLEAKREELEAVQAKCPHERFEHETLCFRTAKLARGKLTIRCKCLDCTGSHDQKVSTPICKCGKRLKRQYGDQMCACGAEYRIKDHGGF